MMLKTYMFEKSQTHIIDVHLLFFCIYIKPILKQVTSHLKTIKNNIAQTFQPHLFGQALGTYQKARVDIPMYIWLI